MRTIYLICHGEPEFPGDKRFCLSHMDLPLSPVGKMQGVLLGQYLSQFERPKVYHSIRSCAEETAGCLAQESIPALRFHELGMGDWEGLTRQEIMERYPELYQQRLKNPMTCSVPGGEQPNDCRKRALTGLSRILVRTEGDLAIVAHTGVNQLMLCSLLRRPIHQFLTIPQPYGCLNTLRESDGEINVESVGVCPHPVLDDALCRSLLEAAGAAEDIIRHGFAVAEKAEALADKAAKAGVFLNRENLRAAALLHDIARARPNHPTVGAEWLHRLGYPEIGEIIACHHDLDTEQERQISEMTILYLADKLVQDDREVTLETRFSGRGSRFTTEEAMLACTRRYEQAQRVERFFEKRLRGVAG